MLGDYDKSLESYHAALELNPYHRGALEYLGEAYLELGDRERARMTLERLREACRLGGAGASGKGGPCPELRALEHAIAGGARREDGPRSGAGISNRGSEMPW